MKRATKMIGEYTQQSKLFWIIVLTCLSSGVFIGAITLVSLDAESFDAISTYLSSFISLSGQEAIDCGRIFTNASASILQLGIFLWLCGLTKIGLPIAPAIVGIRGFACGFTIAALMRNYASMGLWASAIAILPQMLILLPCMSLFSVLSMKQATQWGSISDKSEKRQRFLHYTIFSILIITAMFICALIEAYISPFLLMWTLAPIQ